MDLIFNANLIGLAYIRVIHRQARKLKMKGTKTTTDIIAIVGEGYSQRLEMLFDEIKRDEDRKLLDILM